MTCNLKLLQELNSVPWFPVGLPNGQKVLATKKETKTLEGRLKISNVLYVPKLIYNCICVQLMDTENCIV